MNAQEYITKRLSTNRDDRQELGKQSADVQLRGSIGETEAKKIIETIDSLKARR